MAGVEFLCEAKDYRLLPVWWEFTRVNINATEPSWFQRFSKTTTSLFSRNRVLGVYNTGQPVLLLCTEIYLSERVARARHEDVLVHRRKD